MTGPLKGVRIVEFAGIGPGPFAAMLLSDLGAEIIRIDRVPAVGRPAQAPPNPLLRGRRSLCLDLTQKPGADIALGLIARADALIEGYRPGKMEKLGLGPDACLKVNPRLVYGRMTGWGQDGPYAPLAGHDINYIALAGPLGLIGRQGAPPTVPLNLVGDFGGGALFLALGIVSALFEAKSSGRGQVVDAAMIDGAANLMASFFFLHAAGRWGAERGTNYLDSGAPHYDVYETADGKWVSVGSLEPQFYRLLRDLLHLDGPLWEDQQDRSLWAQRHAALVDLFRTKTRDEWCALLEKADLCFAPVLSLEELPTHPHHRARGAFRVRDGVIHPAPAPRFSRTASQMGAAARAPGADSAALLAELGLGMDRIGDLIAAGIVHDATNETSRDADKPL